MHTDNLCRFNIESRNKVDANGEVNNKFQWDLRDNLNEERGKKNIVSNAMKIENSGRRQEGDGALALIPGVLSNVDHALATLPKSGEASKKRQEYDNVTIATTGQNNWNFYLKECFKLGI